MKNIPIPTIHLFPVLEEQLIQLLHSLKAEEWNRPTIARLWTVKDVAAHLLDGNIRVLSMVRDNYTGDAPGNIFSNEDLVGYLNGLNADWVKAMKRVSPQALTALLEITGKQYCQQLALLDPFAPAIFAVSWAGETNSINWFHIAREYTERWHHQQQIRDAVGKPAIMTRELYHPVLDTFMMALPYTYRNTEAKENTVIKISVSGEAGGDWFIIKKENWELVKTNNLPVTAHTIINGDIAWKLFTKSWRRKEVMEYVSMEGDAVLGAPVLDMIAVMA
ncbi:MAG TPA: maleylpyruvate isomerase N-terminal domain-containing protein [Chitinophagaceae bacterium]|nr:maleylpyruvate isomerase N-terminal domain-containing protein [Chitinophagaceae bacterium]